MNFNEIFILILKTIFAYVFLLIILPREVKINSFPGGSQYKLVGANWTVWVAFGMAVVKLINDFHIFLHEPCFEGSQTF